MKKRTPLAFFDLDHTLLPHDTMLLFCNFLLRKHPLRRAYLFILFVPFATLGALRIAGSGALKRVFFSFLHNLRRDELDALARAFVPAEVIPRLFPELLAEIEAKRREGCALVLNTASPAFYAQYIAEALGFDYCFATPMILDDTMPLIPRLAGPNNKRFAKIKAMQEILPQAVQEQIRGMEYRDLTEELLAGLTIPGSSGYTDSPADIPMLLLSERKYLVAPVQAAFIARASREHWSILQPELPYAGIVSRFWLMLRQFLGIYK